VCGCAQLKSRKLFFSFDIDGDADYGKWQMANGMNGNGNGI
jgi:hypothetical protein